MCGDAADQCVTDDEDLWCGSGGQVLIFVAMCRLLGAMLVLSGLLLVSCSDNLDSGSIAIGRFGS